MTMELSRKRMRATVLRTLKYIRTCLLARELCFHIRSNLAVLDKKDVSEYCAFISELCREYGCEEASRLCKAASEAVLHSEEEFLRLCAESCKKCGEQRRPKITRGTTSYIA